MRASYEVCLLNEAMTWRKGGWKFGASTAGSSRSEPLEERGFEPLATSDREVRRLLRKHASSVWIQSTPEEIDRYWNTLGEEELCEIDADLSFASEHLELLEFSGVTSDPSDPRTNPITASAYQGQAPRIDGASPVIARFGFGTALLIGLGAVGLTVAAGLIIYLLISGQTVDIELRDHIWYSPR